MRLLAAMLLAICAIQLFAVSNASAETMTFRFKNDHRSVVNFELYARARHHVWPGNREVYTLKDSASHQVKIACQAGEKVCYGAWVKNSRSKEWGTGFGGKGGCARCCYRCDGGATPILVIN